MLNFLKRSTSKLKTINFSSSKFKLSEMKPEKKDSKIVALWKKYGVLAIVTHLSIYSVTLGTLYLGLRNEWFVKKDAGKPFYKFINSKVELLKSSKLDSYIDVSNLNRNKTNFAVAWVLTKFTEPIRIPITILITTVLGKRIKRFIK
jgi:hypothetical protein